MDIHTERGSYSDIHAERERLTFTDTTDKHTETERLVFKDTYTERESLMFKDTTDNNW